MNDLEIHLKKAESAGCYPAAIELSELLQTRGFAFLTASAGGGCDDLYHTGTVAYYAKYSGYEDFKNCFEADYDKKYGELKAEYGSWMSSLDYEDIFLEMKKDDFPLCALVENYGYKIRIWTRAEDIRAREEMALLLQFLETLPQYSIRM